MAVPGKRVLLAGAVALVSVLAGSGGPWPVLQPAYAGTADGAPAMPGRLGIPSQPILPGASVGYLPGSGSVTPQGGYTYTLPLEVPAGRAGMQPSLALSYASGGNGVLGVGWSLSGLSSITRCGQTLSTQGYVGGVHMTDFPADPAAGVPEDSFCLDGQTLVAINRQAYGQDGTEYRTELDSYARIVSSSSSGAVAPDAFTVQTKSGLTLTYQALDAPLWSATAASITPAGTVHDVWMLTQQVDALGNGVIYQYTTLSEATQPDGSYGVQHLLTEIDYTVSGALSGGGQTPVRSTGRAYRAVQFTYEDRPDGERGWQGGRQITLLRRLQTITMLAPDPTDVLRENESSVRESFSAN